jgi:pimeloyl-ACP methyl ester carboxylesterase
MKRFTWILLVVFSVLLVPTYAQDYVTPQELADENGAFVDVNGISIYYTVEGEVTNPAVILIHGFSGNTSSWHLVQPVLAEAGYYAIAVDLPPFGLSDKNPDIDMSRSGMADIVAGFMDTLGIESATLVGHSMGGAVTAQVAVRHPDKVERLVFVAGGIFEAIEREESEEDDANPLQSLLANLNPNNPASVQLLRTFINRDYFAQTLESAYFDDSLITEEAIDGYAKLLLIEDAPAGFLAYLGAEEQNPITLQQLVESTTVPVLILWGIEDTWVPLQLGETMAEAYGERAELVTFANVGHVPMEELTDGFNEALINFLNN